MRWVHFKRQLERHFVALVSLTVAIAALLYTAWREETTEKNRTLRVAGFEVLKNLGELQIVINRAFYQQESTISDPYLGWGHIALISDLSQLLPEPVPTTCAKLVSLWGENVQKISTDEEAVTQLSDQIDTSRHEILQSIRYLR